jgi:hypothetical protein
VFFEMLTGPRPFKFEDFYARRAPDPLREPPPLASLGVDRTPAAAGGRRRLHQKDPEKRYGDEMSLLADLAELGALGGLNLQSGVVRSPP